MMPISRTNLTARERQILRRIGRGEASKEIAHALGISVWTVASHRKRICAKLGVHTSAELVALAVSESAGNVEEAQHPNDDVCRLAVDFRGGNGRTRFTYSGRLKQRRGTVTVRIGQNTYHF